MRLSKRSLRGWEGALSGQLHCLMEAGGCWAGGDSKREGRHAEEKEGLKENCNNDYFEIMH